MDQRKRKIEKDVTASFDAGLTESVLCSFIFQLVKQEVVSVATATLPVLLISAKSAFFFMFSFYISARFLLIFELYGDKLGVSKSVAALLL